MTPAPLFHLVCDPAALDGAPDGWAAAMLHDGEIALLADFSGMDAINAIAHALDLATVSVLRIEETDERQNETVIAYAGSLPLVWLAPAFSEPVQAWAHKRGPMTLLVEVHGALTEDDRRRIERFVAVLGRQAD